MLTHLDFQGTLDQHHGQLPEQAIFANQVFRFPVVRKQAVHKLDQFRITLGPTVAYYVAHFLIFGGRVLPKDRLHKTQSPSRTEIMPDQAAA
ncbi:hypothetical protein GCM10022212_11360 [Actimicrobium antarcticum]|uniref:Uncharacterized protein n=1 Tax=Actimicrobium antarcticum TaxID=1051899 RepID=A0ABP7SWK3_9BURK